MTPRDRQRLQTREDIVDVTGAVLRTAGYAGVRIEDVCARAGVSRGAFYHHFPTKEAAIVALLERDSMVLVEYGALIRDRAAGDPALHAALSLALALRFAERQGPIAHAYHIDTLGLPEAQALRDRIEVAWEARILIDFQETLDAGTLLSLDPRTTVQAAFAAAKRMAVAFLQGRVADLDGALRELVRFTLMGLGVGRDRAIELGDQAVEFRLPA